jgi:hypothetical protein
MAKTVADYEFGQEMGFFDRENLLLSMQQLENHIYMCLHPI